MLTITTDENRILIGKNHMTPLLYQKGELQTYPWPTGIALYEGREKRYFCENFENDITINGEQVTPENYREKLSELFF